RARFEVRRLRSRSSNRDKPECTARARAYGSGTMPFMPATKARARSTGRLRQLDAWWRGAHFLSVGQIYLLDNPLLRRPLASEDVKPRLLGHWGTTPGLNFVYAHANR